jgi:hypothetical protein
VKTRAVDRAGQCAVLRLLNGSGRFSSGDDIGADPLCYLFLSKSQ